MTLQLGRTKEALDFYEKARAISERLAEADPKNVDAQRDLVAGYLKIGTVAQLTHDFTTAAQWYEKALDVTHRFDKPEFCTQEVGELKNRLAICGNIDKVLADVSSAKKLPADLRAPVLAAGLAVLLAKNDLPKARQAAEQLAELATRPVDYCRAACGFARLSPIGDKDAREKDAQRAMNLLRQAVAKGFKDDTYMKEEKDLDSLREREDFKKLIAELKKAIPEQK